MSSTGSTVMVKLALTCCPPEFATVATYVVVLVGGNVAEPVGKVSWRSSASGSGGAKLMDDALLVVQLNVVSWPATTVCKLAESEIVGGPGAGGGGVGGTPGGAGGVGGAGGFRPFPSEVVCGMDADPLPPHPAQKATIRTAAKTKSV